MKNVEVRIASDVMIEESALWRIVRITFEEPSFLFEEPSFLIHATSLSVSNPVIKAKISFSVSKNVLLAQKLKFNWTPEGCS